jgi:hypothetical protein
MRFTGIVVFCFCSLLALSEAVAQTPSSSRRSFNDIFQEIAPSVRQAAFSNEGYAKSAENITSSSLVGANGIDRQIIDSVFVKKPGFLVESIKVVPGNDGQYSLLDVYNALGNIRGLKGRLYHSHTRDENIPLFEDVTRLENAKKNTPVADPPPAARIPASETIYMRLKDANFGNSFYRGDIALYNRGLRYGLTNNKNITYYFIPVIKEERFVVQLYFEVIAEGVLIYSLAGADVSDFVSSKINMPSAINKRLAVIISWAAEGITGRS